MPRVLIGVPVFNGGLTLPETLRCIQQQTFGDFEVIISLDGGDCGSADVIRPFLSDPRFRSIQQTERLGWADNLDWIMGQCQAEFFCYWQQDDIASHNYIGDLISVHERNPGASVTYTDVQWFGDVFAREALPSLDASMPRDRVLQYMDLQHWIPLRGLVRSSFINKLPDWARLCSNSPWENGFLSHLAGCGPLLRSMGALYFKRSHRQQWGASFESRPLDQRRRDWATRAKTLLRALDAFSPEDLSSESVALVANRFVNAPKDRFVDYRYTEPSAARRFLRDLVALFPDEMPDRLIGCANTSAGDVAAETDAELVRRRTIKTNTQFSFAAEADSQGEPYLGFGWSHGEPWGVWSEVANPSLFLPVVPSRATLVLHGHHYGVPGQPVDMGWSIDGHMSGEVTIPCMEPTTLEIPLGPESRLLSLQLPHAITPVEVSGSVDARRLGFGLIGMQIRFNPTEQ